MPAGRGTTWGRRSRDSSFVREADQGPRPGQAAQPGAARRHGRRRRGRGPGQGPAGQHGQAGRRAAGQRDREDRRRDRRSARRGPLVRPRSRQRRGRDRRGQRRHRESDWRAAVPRRHARLDRARPSCALPAALMAASASEQGRRMPAPLMFHELPLGAARCRGEFGHEASTLTRVCHTGGVYIPLCQ